MNSKLKRILVNPFFVSIIVLLFLLITLFFGTLYWLDNYTNHGEEIVVPDLKGMGEQEVAQRLSDKKLQYEIIDSVFVKGKKPGTVMEQTPEAGSKVKEERTIYLIINARSPRKIVLPDLRDVSLRQAEAIITSIGLKVGNYEYVPSEYKDLVQDVKYENLIAPPGTRITEGAAITLLVGKGLSDEMTTVVSLRGLTLEQAIEKAHVSSLNIGATIYDVNPLNDKEKASYFVYRQEPLTNSRVSSGQSVNLFLTKDKSLLDTPEELAETDSTIIIEDDNEPWD
jgi:beta-lactam-binding protein with PASTA domain